MLSNAVKFSSAGGKIKVRVESAKVEGREFVAIKVIDQGKGIRPEVLSNIFERFYQVDSSSVRLHGGLGIGLALVRDLVRLHGGSVRAESDGLGRGSTFTVLLPKKMSPSETSCLDSVFTNNPAAVEPDVPNLDGHCILIVDDDPNTLEVLNETLISFGAQTIACSSAAEAMICIENQKLRPDILVSDIAMPGQDGYVLIRTIRGLAGNRNRSIPALALTAYASEGDVNRALSAGFDLHLAKPFDNFRLGRALANLIKRRTGLSL